MRKIPGKQGAQEAIARQWAMLRQIPRQPHAVTAATLKSRLDSEGYLVAKRTVERDLHTLSAYFPIVCEESQKPFLWSWKQDAPNLHVPGLSSMEALTFHLAQRHLGGILPASAMKALSPHFQLAEKTLSQFARAKAWTEKIRVVPATQPLLPPKVRPEAYEAITEALLNEQMLKVKYRRRSDGKVIDYDLNPLALVQRGYSSYLIASAFDFTDPLLFALHRFSSAQCMAEPAMHIDGFNLDTYIADGGLGFGRDGKKIRLEALFDQETARHFEEAAVSSDQTLASTADGRVRLKATVANTPQLQWWLLGFGECVEVLRPKALRRNMATSLRETLKRYT